MNTHETGGPSRSLRLSGALALGTAAALSIPASGSTPESFQGWLDAVVDSSDVPGVSVAWIDQTGALHASVAGVSDRESATPMSADAVMLSGSIGKTYVAAVLVSMLREGTLALDDPLSAHLGDQPWFDRVPNARAITVRHLANHTAGIPDHVWFDAFQDSVRSDPMRSYSPDELVAFVLDAEPVHPAGEGWGYSDTNYVVLARAMEAASGRALNDLIRERVLMPAELVQTACSEKPDLPGLIPGYSGVGEAFAMPEKVAEPGRYAINPQWEWAGGGLCSTTRDLARFLHALMTTDTLVSDAERSLMTEGVEADARIGVGSRYGLGLIIRDTPNGPSWGHSGIMPGYLSSVEHYPDLGVTVAVQVNTDRPPAGALLRQVTDRVLESLAE